ncbi:MAG: ABC transporter ATP-binding protein [Eubacteriales bacterium]|nr:ABC transporter ATP-binding protein [Eubacteriales bacterium]
MKYLIKDYKLKTFLAFFFICISSITLTYLNYVRGLLLNHALDRDLRSLIITVLTMLFLALFKSYTHYLYAYYEGYLSHSIARDFRSKIFTGILGRSFVSFNSHPQGYYLGNMTETIAVYTSSCHKSWYGLMQIITEFVFVMFAFLLINIRLLFLIILLMLPTIFLPLLFRGMLKKRMSASINSYQTNLTRFSEAISAFEVVKNHHATAEIEEQFSHYLNEQVKSRSKFMRAHFISQNISQLVSGLTVIIAIAYSAELIRRGIIDTGQFIAAMGFMGMLSRGAMWITSYIQAIMVSKDPETKLLTAIDEPELMPLPAPNLCLREIDTIEFDRVSFSYDKTATTPLINQFQAKLDKPGVYWLKGGSGSGKSTLTNLLQLYYHTDGGQILINDTDILKVDNLNQHISIMRQEAGFLLDTLRNNLTMYNPQISDAQIYGELANLGLEELAKAECLDEVLIHAEQRFSGGEARRLALLRALLKPAEILILDEPLANIDPLSLELISKRIFLEEARFIILISHQEPVIPPGYELVQTWDLELINQRYMLE